MLPEDLIFEILLRLPVKPLLRFRSVSKNWRYLITNPTFTKSQYQLSKKQRSSHVVFQYRSIFTFHLNLNHLLHDPIAKHFYKNELVPISSKFFELKKGNCDLLGSCNGIICIHLATTRNLCVWNPTIDEARFISFPNNYQIGFIGQIVFSGFGYAPSIDDYKIVLAVQHRCRRSMAVYSLRRDEWRELDHDYYFSTIPQIYSEKYGGINIQYSAIRMEAVVLSDTLHWIMGNKDKKNSEFFILRFDMVNECFEKFVDLNKIASLDHHHHDENMFLHQAEIGVTEDNKIGVYHVYREFYHQQDKPTIKRDVIEIRVMVDEHGSSWKTKFRYQGRWEDERVHNDLVSIAGNGKVLIFENIRMQMGELGKLQLFDLSQGEPSFIQLHSRYGPPYKFGHTIGYMANYVPSLLSPMSF